jgi:hypothetical protein
MPDPYNFMAGYESGSVLDSLPSSSRGVPKVPTMTFGSRVPAFSNWSDNIDWGQVAATGLAVIPSLFAGSRGSIAGPVSEIQDSARKTGEAGAKLAAEGADALQGPLKYWSDLLSGDPNASMAATAPERRRIIDQYDTARRSSAQFTPRGGGQASTQMESRAQEAGDLATVGATARENAASALGSLGLNQQQVGLTMQQQAQQQLAQVLGPLMQQQRADSDSTLGAIKGLASLAALFI